MGDIFRVPRSSRLAGSRLSMALLDAVGPSGRLISVERRQDFADIAAANVDLWFDAVIPRGICVGDVDEVLWVGRRGEY